MRHAFFMPLLNQDNFRSCICKSGFMVDSEEVFLANILDFQVMSFI